ncbi:hypothetical protein RvY_17442 [Ramazzottius varieornatus]|uniref:Uncharacterized protein n=1 Tax=Ramazzottius varieornatus TaxID=947166 RepID=A0A1D1W247_RAMVA|nr:hypothetical protein RvY_17442 [Ramazzottius varieornatus]
MFNQTSYQPLTPQVSQLYTQSLAHLLPQKEKGQPCSSMAYDQTIASDPAVHAYNTHTQCINQTQASLHLPFLTQSNIIKYSRIN